MIELSPPSATKRCTVRSQTKNRIQRAVPAGLVPPGLPPTAEPSQRTKQPTVTKVGLRIILGRKPRQHIGSPDLPLFVTSSKGYLQQLSKYIQLVDKSSPRRIFCVLMAARISLLRIPRSSPPSVLLSIHVHCTPCTSTTKITSVYTPPCLPISTFKLEGA